MFTLESYQSNYHLVAPAKSRVDKVKSSEPKMVQKTWSFREGLKMFRSSPPSSGSTRRKSRSSRGDSPASQSEGGKDVGGHLQGLTRKVVQTLHYIRDIAGKCEKEPRILSLLPGATMIVLETVIEVTTTVSGYFSNKDSSVLLACFKRLNRGVAELVKWSDVVQINSGIRESTDEVMGVIDMVQKAVDDLVQTAVKLLREGPTSPVKPALSLDFSHNGSHASSSGSLPDTPPTPQDRQLMVNALDPASSPQPPMSPAEQSSDSGSMGSPPPKPPKPSNGAFSWELWQSSPLNASPSASDLTASLTASQLTSFSWCPGGTPEDDPLAYDESGSTGSSPRSSVRNSMESLLSSASQSCGNTGLPKPFTRRSTGYDNSPDIKPGHRASLGSASVGEDSVDGGPPPLPAKSMHRAPSEYDNVGQAESDVVLRIKVSPHKHPGGSQASLGSSHASSQMSSGLPSPKHSPNCPNFHKSRLLSSSSSVHQRYTVASSSASSLSSVKGGGGLVRAGASNDTGFWSGGTGSDSSRDSLHPLGSRPPPLPLKSKHVEAYMQMFGENNYESLQQAPLPSFTRNSVAGHHFYQENFKKHQHELRYSRMAPSEVSTSSSSVNNSAGVPGAPPTIDEDEPPPALPPKQRHRRQTALLDSQAFGETPPSSVVSGSLSGVAEEESVSSESSGLPASSTSSSSSSPPDPLQMDDVVHLLTEKNPNEQGHDIRGGVMDVLLVHAISAGGKDFMFQEAFLTTYRTIMSPVELVDKLFTRYSRLTHDAPSSKRRKLARTVISFLIRVVDDLCGDISSELLQSVSDLVFELLIDGELVLARILRTKVMEKVEQRRKTVEQPLPPPTAVPKNYMENPGCLLDFKASVIAEQMTLLDAEFFSRIEIPEVLLWAKEQSEELSPNLTKFTEHFNHTSYWCRTRILEHVEQKERDKYFVKFVKVMKHLRRLKNFNSFLAILSAVDSGPIRRLEWNKVAMETVREHASLIDSSQSFRCYREALEDAEPPCIPYIGLVLQDLTFVQIGNQDTLDGNGTINFWKRWQMFHIIENMHRFRKSRYSIRRSPRVIAMFENFSNYLCEETLWQVSENLKPREGRKPVGLMLS